MKKFAQTNLQSYPLRWWAFAAISISLLIISVDATVLNVALPTLAHDLAATASQQQWIVDAYTLVYAGLMLSGGSLSDRFGRKRALMIGLLIFGAGSLWCAFSRSALLLIFARGFMGIGGALIMPSTLSITTNMFSEKERPTAIGAWTGIAGLGIIIGPLLGGWLLEHFSWGTVFLINVPILLLTLVASLFLVPESKDPHASPLDPVGAVLSITGLTALLYGTIEVPTYGWGDRGVILSFVAAAILLTAFIVWEMRSHSPMLDVTLFSNPRFSAASLSATLGSFALMGTLFFLTQYLQFVLGYSPLNAGIRIFPLVPTLIVSAVLAPRVVRWIGLKFTVTLGMVITAAGFYVMSLISVSSGYGIVALALSILGFGFGLSMSPAADSIMGALPPERAGVGSAVNDTSQEVGGALGVAVLGSILAALYHNSMDQVKALQLLPANVRAIVHDSIGGATLLAHQLPAAMRGSIIGPANAAFVDAMSHTVLAGTAMALCGGLVALLFLPLRQPEARTNLTQDGDAATMEPEQKEGATIS